jgi:uncharacterized protein YkwD
MYSMKNSTGIIPRISLLVAFIGCAFIATGFRNSALQVEKYPFSKWDKAIVDKATAAAQGDYMTAEEIQVIVICNLARMQPKLFAETYLQKYIDESGQVKNTYVTSLFSDLKKTKPMQPMKAQKDLFKSAQEHALSSGQKGTIGHQNMSKRFKTHAPRYNMSGENCDYGNENAMGIVMSLLIDEDVPDKGHRKNILEPKFIAVGVAIRPHKKYDHNAVMCFGDK